MPISGSFSATLAGFAPGGSWAQLSVSASSSRVLLPSGTVVVVYNVGANGAFVAIGNSGIVATTGEDYIPAGGALALTVGANTYIAGITSSSTTTLNISGGSGLPTGWGSGGLVMCLNASGQAAPCGPTNPLSVAPAGTTGLDYSANKPTLPNVGANFAASGPYASYYLIATVTAAQQKSLVQVWNTSGAQIAIIRDDGTAASAAAPTNATVFSLAGGTAVGSQGGSYADANFKGRLQIYAPSSTAQVAVSVE
jgi:hypothetical protein